MMIFGFVCCSWMKITTKHDKRVSPIKIGVLGMRGEHYIMSGSRGLKVKVRPSSTAVVTIFAVSLATFVPVMPHGHIFLTVVTH